MPLFDVFWDEGTTFCVTVEADSAEEARENMFDPDWWCQDWPNTESGGWVIDDSIDVVEVK